MRKTYEKPAISEISMTDKLMKFPVFFSRENPGEIEAKQIWFEENEEEEMNEDETDSLWDL